jgi:hypothetical protein
VNGSSRVAELIFSGQLSLTLKAGAQRSPFEATPIRFTNASIIASVREAPAFIFSGCVWNGSELTLRYENVTSSSNERLSAFGTPFIKVGNVNLSSLAQWTLCISSTHYRRGFGSDAK